MFDTCEQTREFALIEAIAVALREELGVAIEEQPGFRDPSEAGQVNRAFRAMARTILRTIASPDEDLPALLSRVLGRLARRRLEAGLLDAHEVDHLLGLRAGRPRRLARVLDPDRPVGDRASPANPRPRSRLTPAQPVRPHPPPTRSVTKKQEDHMTLAERLSEFVRAAFTGLWVQSFEHDDAIAEIARLCRQQQWALATWDIDRGLNFQGRDPSFRHGCECQ